jgi:hypothetical protein
MQPSFIVSVRHNVEGFVYPSFTAVKVSVHITQVCFAVCRCVSKPRLSNMAPNTAVFPVSSGNASFGGPVTALSGTTGSHPFCRSYKIRPCTTMDQLRKRRCKHSRKTILNRSGLALRIPEVWDSHISRHSAHENGKVVSPTHRPPLPQEIFVVLISLTGRIDLRVTL